MSWADDLQRIAGKGQQDLGRLARAVKIDLFSGTVEDTRVKFGRLKGNWQIQESAAASGVLNRLDPEGNQVMAEINAGASEVGRTYFVNNLPYAKKFENEDAMVARNVRRLKRIVRKAARKLR